MYMDVMGASTEGEIERHIANAIGCPIEVKQVSGNFSKVAEA